MKREEYENPMIRPRSWELEPEYSYYCSKCGNGIQWGEKFYRLPWRKSTHEILCEKCTEDMTSYAKHSVICAECGEWIREDDDCFIGEDAEVCICLDCLEEDQDADFSIG